MEWYYASKGEKAGPVEAGVIINLLAKQEIPSGTLVWNETFGSTWKKASEVPELQQSPNRTPALPSGELAPEVDAETPEFSETLRFTVRKNLGKIVFLALVLAAGLYVWRHYFYTSPAVETYERYALACFEYRFEDALKMCAQGQAYDEVSKKLQAMNELKVYRDRSSGLAKTLAPDVPAAPSIVSKGYSVLSEKKKGNSADIKIEQRMRILTEYSPFQATLVTCHTATLVKDGEAWKVVTSQVEDRGVFNPMSGQKM